MQAVETEQKQDANPEEPATQKASDLQFTHLAITADVAANLRRYLGKGEHDEVHHLILGLEDGLPLTVAS